MLGTFISPTNNTPWRIRIPWSVVTILGLLGAFGFFTLSVQPTTASNDDVPATSININAGVFFPTQTAPTTHPPSGFSVTDDRGILLWTAWQNLGGERTLGVPTSRRFTLHGQIAQVFERGILRWHPVHGVSVVNVLGDLSARGHDDLLLDQFGVPPSHNWSADTGDTWDGIYNRHMALLNGPESWRSALRAAYTTGGGKLENIAQAISLHGLPMAIGRTTMGYALRAQRAAWVIAPEPGAAVSRVDLTTLLTTTATVPPHAITPHRPDERPHLRPVKPVSGVHFFDWWRDANLPTKYFTHELSWDRIGITPSQIGTAAYYDANFRHIRDLGVDGVIWEWYDGANLDPTPTVLDSLRRHDLKIGIFYDWELLHAGGQAVLSDRAYIAPDETSLKKIADEVIAFYKAIPRDLWLYDANGRLPIFVYAYGFPEHLTNTAAWTWFFTELPRRVESSLDADVIFDWSVAYLPPSQVQEFAFERWPETYAPFNFVVDLPQSQFGHHVVTWNFIFDNRGVAARDGLPRVIRDDNRYLEETAWLATHTQPSLVFIYSWNEFWEGSHLFPDDTYGWKRYNLARAQLADIADSRADDLPHALIIIDPADAHRSGTNGLFENQRILVRNFLRRYVPQATVITPANATAAKLANYDLIVSLTTDRRVDPVLEALPARVQIVYWNATDLTTTFAHRFVERVEADRPIGRRAILDSTNTPIADSLLAEGDVWCVKLSADAVASLHFDDNGTPYPLVAQSDNDHWINIYGPTEAALETVFSAVYGRTLEAAITFALGGRIQRLEIYPDGRVIQNTFSAPAVFRHDPLAIPGFQPAPPADLPINQ